jgi:acetyl-CoA acetyltransferase
MRPVRMLANSYPELSGKDSPVGVNGGFISLGEPTSSTSDLALPHLLARVLRMAHQSSGVSCETTTPMKMPPYVR